MQHSSYSRGFFIGMFLSVGLSTAAFSGELLYNPINPAFGGNPNYADYLFSSAQLQNQHVPESGGGGGGNQGVPQINFPPITIDLGNTAAGLGGGTAPMQVDNGTTTTSP